MLKLIYHNEYGYIQYICTLTDMLYLIYILSEQLTNVIVFNLIELCVLLHICGRKKTFLRVM